MIGRPFSDRCGATDEVHLATDARILLATKRVGADLARQIDFKRAVDGRHLRIATNHVGVVHIRDVEHLHHRVVVHKVVQPSAADGKTGDDRTRMNFFDSLVMMPRSTRSMTPSENISVWMLSRRCEPSAASTASGIAPIPHLQRRAVFHQTRNPPTDGALDVGQWLGTHSISGSYTLHHRRQSTDVDQPIAVRARHVGIDLGNQDAAHFAARATSTETPSEQKPCRSGGETQKRHIERQNSATEQPRHFGQKHLDVVGPSGVHRVAGCDRQTARWRESYRDTAARRKLPNLRCMWTISTPRSPRHGRSSRK